MEVEFVKREQKAKNVYAFWFKPEKPLTYTAGQFIELLLPHNSPDNRGQKRWFTLSSPPGQELFSITTKIIRQKSSFKARLNTLKPGETAKIILPMGDFVLPKDKNIKLIFIAGGIGCTPYASIIADLQNKSENRDITLLYSANSDKEIAYAEIFSKLGSRFQKYTDHLLTTQAILSAIGGAKKFYIYLSGPEPMVESLQQQLISQSVPQQRIRTDFFPNYRSI